MSLSVLCSFEHIRPISYFPLQSHKHELNCGNGQRRERWPTESNFRRGQRGRLCLPGSPQGQIFSMEMCSSAGHYPRVRQKPRVDLNSISCPLPNGGSGNQCFGNAFLRARSPMWMDGWLWENVNVETASEKSDVWKRVRVILPNFACIDCITGSYPVGPL